MESVCVGKIGYKRIQMLDTAAQWKGLCSVMWVSNDGTLVAPDGLRRTVTWAKQSEGSFRMLSSRISADE